MHRSSRPVTLSVPCVQRYKERVHTMNTTLSGKKIAKIVLIVVAVLAVLLVILSSFTVVPVGHRGVLTPRRHPDGHLAGRGQF